jgi:redox-sensitive bicupin YhaK (pirin superfamily)
MINGEIHHRDSRGNDQVAGPGEVQWMNAGAGIIHSERPSQKIVDEQIAQEFVQLWINTPASHKMNAPKYNYLGQKDIPVVRSDDSRIENKIIAGTWNGISNNKIETDSELMIIWSKALKDGTESIEIPDYYNTMVYVVDGRISIDGVDINAHELAIFERHGSQLTLKSKTDSQYLIISGLPINERIFQHGPFVMNNRTEILQAIRDYQMGKMGVLIEEQ